MFEPFICTTPTLETFRQRLHRRPSLDDSPADRRALIRMLPDVLLTKCSKLLLDVARPLLRHLPRGSGTLYRCLGGYRRSAFWNGYGFRMLRGVDHGFQMRLSLGNVFERETYYLGRFYEWELQRLLQSYIRPGDTVIDVGANIGMITLCAAARVGPHGTVLSFEPNPDARAILNEHIRLNDLRNVRAFALALGEGPGAAELTMASTHTSTSTLRRVHNGGQTFPVHVASLDSFLGWIPASGRVLLKIDTEGYDFSVLKGARTLLARPGVVVFAEVNHNWLRELGQNAEQMFRYMERLGFTPYLPRLQTRLLRRKLKLQPLLLPGPHYWFNTLFVRQADFASIQR
jgi:FkbM family methyltransferase